MGVANQIDPADPRRWTWRRLAIFITILASFLIIGVAATLGGGDAVRVTAIGTLGGLLAIIVPVYVFAPTVEAAWSVLVGWIQRRNGQGS